MSNFLTLSDEELGLAELQIEVRIQELGEMDMLAGDPDTEESYPEVIAAFATREAIFHEQNERRRLGIVMQHDHERFEVRFAPFGPEWQLEQEERFEEACS